MGLVDLVVSKSRVLLGVIALGGRAVITVRYLMQKRGEVTKK